MRNCTSMQLYINATESRIRDVTVQYPWHDTIAEDAPIRFGEAAAEP